MKVLQTLVMAPLHCAMRAQPMTMLMSLLAATMQRMTVAVLAQKPAVQQAMTAKMSQMKTAAHSHVLMTSHLHGPELAQM